MSGKEMKLELHSSLADGATHLLNPVRVKIAVRIRRLI